MGESGTQGLEVGTYSLEPATTEGSPIGPNREKRAAIFSYQLTKRQKELQKVVSGAQIDSGSGGGTSPLGITPESFSDEPLTEEETRSYQAMLAEKEAEQERLEREAALKKILPGKS